MYIAPRQLMTEEGFRRCPANSREISADSLIAAMIYWETRKVEIYETRGVVFVKIEMLEPPSWEARRQLIYYRQMPLIEYGEAIHQINLLIEQLEPGRPILTKFSTEVKVSINWIKEGF